MADAQPPELLWEPSPQQRERATLTRYMRWLEAERGLALADYDELWRWSTTDLEGFWSSLWEFFDVRASEPYECVLGEREMPGAQWFPGARLNYAEHVFRHGRPEEPAILHASELRELSTLTRGELRDQVARAAAGLRALGVGRGDRVVAYMPNVPETVIAFLACASIGAIWSSAAPEFGTRSVVDRFAQIEPAVLIAVDGYRYGGRDFDRMETLAALRDAMPTLRRVVVLPYLRENPDLGGLGAAITWEELLDGSASGEGESRGGAGDSGGGDGDGDDRDRSAELRFEQVPFDHPLWVLYSSGTTGLPKAIVQGHGGILLEQLKKGHLHLDLKPEDRLFWFTTTGWMMWNFLIGGLLTEAAIVLYDGSPAHPGLSTLFKLAERTGMTCLGTSAGFLSSCMKMGMEPGRDHDLSTLRSVGSTGSPLAPEAFHWVYEHVKPDLWLFSTSGGTDVCTAFVGGCPLLPVYVGELQCRALGAAIEAWDEHGRPVVDEVGELVITEPMPSMPLFLWNDPDGERYRESYFAMWSGVWRHGDWIRITPRGGAVIYGRSDSTINRQGVRMGTSEIYRAVNAVEEVVDCLVVDVPRGDGGQSFMPLFVVLREDARLDDELVRQIKHRVRDDCSPRHVPDQVLEVDEIPRTLSGKALEVPVKKILMGTPPERAASADSLSNPGALDYFVELARRL